MATKGILSLFLDYLVGFLPALESRLTARKKWQKYGLFRSLMPLVSQNWIIQILGLTFYR